MELVGTIITNPMASEHLTETCIMVSDSSPSVTADDQREFARALGVGETTTSERPTLAEIRDAIDAETDSEFASMGEAIRSDLSGKLDGELIEENLDELATQIERLPEVREAGIPEGETEAEQLYRDLIAPAWRIYRHLVDVDFFPSVEANLPRFTSEHIEHTANELIRTDEFTAALEDCGFDEREQLILMMNVVNNTTSLARWVPTREIPDGVEFDVDHVPPLHQRAMGGALLWINAIDTHLWQKEVLITEDILDDGQWDTKAMLGGLYVMSVAARDIAGEDRSLTDAQLAAALTGSAAMLIVNQEEIMKDMFWITEEKRKPSVAR
jgi:hypothetical protein